MLKFEIKFLYLFIIALICVAECQQNNVCPDNKPLVNCFISPCLNRKCETYPDAKCFENYCGGCNYEFRLKDQTVDCNEPFKCPGNQSLATCLVSPCYRKRCDNFPEAICKENYCGGCYNYFVVDNKPVECSSSRALVVLIVDVVAKFIQYLKIFMGLFGW